MLTYQCLNDYYDDDQLLYSQGRRITESQYDDLPEEDKSNWSLLCDDELSDVISSAMGLLSIGNMLHPGIDDDSIDIPEDKDDYPDGFGGFGGGSDGGAGAGGDW